MAISNISGARILELRTRLNMSADYFDRRCNLSTNQLRCIEKGRSPVTEELVDRILQSFGGGGDGAADPNADGDGGTDPNADPNANPDKLYVWLKEETDELRVHGAALGSQEEAAIGRLRQVFEESGLSQREFSRRIGVSSTNLTYIFSGKQKFTEKFAKKIESEFDVGADWLLYGDEKNKDFPCGEEMLGYLKKHPEKRKIVWKWMEADER